MPKIDGYNRDGSTEPVANFPTAAEIAIADRLWHQLEKRYRAAPAPSPPSRGRSDENG